MEVLVNAWSTPGQRLVNTRYPGQRQLSWLVAVQVNPSRVTPAFSDSLKSAAALVTCVLSR